MSWLHDQITRFDLKAEPGETRFLLCSNRGRLVMVLAAGDEQAGEKMKVRDPGRLQGRASDYWRIFNQLEGD